MGRVRRGGMGGLRGDIFWDGEWWGILGNRAEGMNAKAPSEPRGGTPKEVYLVEKERASTYRGGGARLCRRFWKNRGFRANNEVFFSLDPLRFGASRARTKMR